MAKINLRITAKRHAHRQTLTKPPAKFQKDPVKTVGGVAFTKFCDTVIRTDRQTDRQKDAW